MHKRSHQPALSLSQLGAVAGIDGDVAEGSGAVVLNVDICGGEQLDKDGDSASSHKLLAVVVW
jgi:hypothetical protein